MLARVLGGQLGAGGLRAALRDLLIFSGATHALSGGHFCAACLSGTRHWECAAATLYPVGPRPGLWQDGVDLPGLEYKGPGCLSTVGRSPDERMVSLSPHPRCNAPVSLLRQQNCAIKAARVLRGVQV